MADLEKIIHYPAPQWCKCCGQFKNYFCTVHFDQKETEEICQECTLKCAWQCASCGDFDARPHLAKKVFSCVEEGCSEKLIHQHHFCTSTKQCFSCKKQINTGFKTPLRGAICYRCFGAEPKGLSVPSKSTEIVECCICRNGIISGDSFRTLAMELIFCMDCETHDLNAEIELWESGPFKCMQEIHSIDMYETVPPGEVVKKLAIRPSCEICKKIFRDYLNLLWWGNKLICRGCCKGEPEHNPWNLPLDTRLLCPSLF